MPRISPIRYKTINIMADEDNKIVWSDSKEMLLSVLKPAATNKDINKKNITIPSDIKELGTYEAAVKIYKGIKGAFKFDVVSE